MSSSLAQRDKVTIPLEQLTVIQLEQSTNSVEILIDRRFVHFYKIMGLKNVLFPWVSSEGKSQAKKKSLSWQNLS